MNRLGHQDAELFERAARKMRQLSEEFIERLQHGYNLAKGYTESGDDIHAHCRLKRKSTSRFIDGLVSELDASVRIQRDPFTEDEPLPVGCVERNIGNRAGEHQIAVTVYDRQLIENVEPVMDVRVPSVIRLQRLQESVGFFEGATWNSRRRGLVVCCPNTDGEMDAFSCLGILNDVLANFSGNVLEAGAQLEKVFADQQASRREAASVNTTRLDFEIAQPILVFGLSRNGVVIRDESGHFPPEIFEVLFGPTNLGQGSVERMQ